MSAKEIDVRARTILVALKWPNGPEKIVSAFKSDLMAASVGGADFGFLTEAAELVHDVKTVVRFLKMTAMMREKVEAYESEAVKKRTLGALADAERLVVAGFREDELEEAKLTIEVMES